MSALIVGCLAASGGAMLGLLIGTSLACGRTQDMEIAYRRLRDAVDRLVDEHSSLPQPPDVWDRRILSLQDAADESDAIVYPELSRRRARAA